MTGRDVVRTVLGDIDPKNLGVTLSHEHLLGCPPPEYSEDDLCLLSEKKAVTELAHFAQGGGGALIEMTTPDYGRNVLALANIAAAAKVHVIAATGFNKAKFAERYSAVKSEDALTAWMVSEVTRGVAEPPDFVQRKNRQTRILAGVIKGSSSLNGPTAAEEKVLRAVARAHLATGAPVSTHTEKATWALEQAAFLLEHGVAPEKLLIGHLDFRPDTAFLAELASTGVFLGIDQITKTKYLADEARAELIVALAALGYQDQLLLSGDLARNAYWKVAGGSGFVGVYSTMKQLLEARGFTATADLFTHNPRRFLSFLPRDSR